MRAHGGDRDARRLVPRKAIDAGRDGREGDRAKPPVLRDRETGLVAAGEDGSLARIAATPDRPDGMDHMSGGQPIAARQPRLARRTATDRTAFGEKLGACRAVDRPIDAAAAEQRGICGVDDRVDPEPRDVATLQANAVVRGQIRDHRSPVLRAKRTRDQHDRSRIKCAGGKPATGRICRIAATW